MELFKECLSIGEGHRIYTRRDGENCSLFASRWLLHCAFRFFRSSSFHLHTSMLFYMRSRLSRSDACGGALLQSSRENGREPGGPPVEAFKELLKATGKVRTGQFDDIAQSKV